MNLARFRRETVGNRLGRRVHQRYLRRLARQPVTSLCLSQGWRSFARSYRRRVNAFGRTRLALVLAVCFGLCGVLFVLGVAAAVVGIVACGPPVLLFAPPEHHPFLSAAERDAVALTRLTALQSIFLPLLFLWAAYCFRNMSRLETPDFYGKPHPARLLGFRLGFGYLLACSTIITLGATIGRGEAVSGVVGTLTVTGCLGWWAWAAAKRLMAAGPPRWLASPGAPVAMIAILGMPLAMVLIPPCFGSAGLTFSQYLPWLGPFGWVNDRLFGLSSGHLENAWPLGLACLLALSWGYWLNRSASTWAFRRRLLTNYRTRVTPQRASTTATGEPRLARDLRQALSGGDWKAWLYPHWMKGRVSLFLLLYGLVFLVQLLLAWLVLFLASVTRQAAPGMVFPEARMLGAVFSSVPGWNVVLLEMCALLLWDPWGLVEFARRPVSPGQVWRQSQWQGVRAIPTQVILAIPFVVVTIVVAPAYFRDSCLAVAVALLACLAIRTTFSAGACYIPAVANLRSWLAGTLGLLGMLAGNVLIFGTLASNAAACLHLEWTLGQRALAVLVPQIVTLTALGIAWGIWHAVGLQRAKARRLA